SCASLAPAGIAAMSPRREAARKGERTTALAWGNRDDGRMGMTSKAVIGATIAEAGASANQRVLDRRSEAAVS
ncbi:MAG TPA: hypothetical protein VLR47_06765, partial [Rhodospirillales bacterium]|nr:hypothetical protein [Rhodospirillales bacterium]